MPKVKQRPKTKKLAVADETPEKLNWIAKVRTFNKDIMAFVSRAKSIEERMTEIVENTDEYEAVGKARTQLAIAQDNLKRRLGGNSEYIKLTEDLAEERLAEKDARGSMSDFLLGYYKESGERQIEIAPDEAREVVIRARLGKKQKGGFQTNMFSAPQEDVDG